MADRTTPATAIRVPRAMWAAYERVCARLGTSRTEDLLEHVRQQIRDHGDERDLADLAAAEKELAERRSRKGGRPPKTDDAGTERDQNGTVRRRTREDDAGRAGTKNAI